MSEQLHGPGQYAGQWWPTYTGYKLHLATANGWMAFCGKEVNTDPDTYRPDAIKAVRNGVHCKTCTRNSSSDNVKARDRSP